MSASKGSITKAGFGATPAGEPVEIYALRNSRGLEARIITYGGIVQSLSVPDKSGRFADVVLGFDSLDGYVSGAYLKGCPYFGALIGRYGNRIANGKFSLNGAEYALAKNNGQNSLHGGLKGFDKVVWTVKAAGVGPRGPRLELAYASKDGEEGFPGNLEVTAVYTLTEDDELKLEFFATTDQPTVFNPTHHSYFNLAGQGNGDVLGHVVVINADRMTPVDAHQIPTGGFADVAGTPFDFRTPCAIGERINRTEDEQIRFGFGYDHNWVVNGSPGKFRLQARVTEPASGRMMEVWSDEPGVQFYTGNFLDGTLRGKGGAAYQRRTGFCFEPQHFPDSPNRPQFPSVALNPGEKFQSAISYKFGAE